MRRKVTDDQLRKTVLARITKGDAFRLDHTAYTERQVTISSQLAKLPRKEIFAAYAYVTYDLR